MAAIEHVMRRLVDELRRRPEACDTFEGLRAFWVDADALLLQSAVDELLARGILRTRHIGGHTHYAAGPAFRRLTRP